jgi:hypothetical protein
MVHLLKKIAHALKVRRARRFALNAPCAAEALIESWANSGKRLKRQHRLYPLTVGEAQVIRETLDKRESGAA